MASDKLLMGEIDALLVDAQQHQLVIHQPTDTWLIIVTLMSSALSRLLPKLFLHNDQL